MIVARHQTEQALHASEARFRAMFYEAAIGIGLGDLQGRIVEVNPTLTEMFGYTAQEMRRRTVGELAHPDDLPSVWVHYERLLAGDLDNFRVEKRFYRKDGEEIICNLTLSLVRDEHGRPAYQVAMLEDVTERHMLQSHLEYQAYHDTADDAPEPRPVHRPHRPDLRRHARRARRAASGSASSTSTGSRRSTTASATRSATSCCRPSRRAWPTRPPTASWSRGWAATSSSCSSRTPAASASSSRLAERVLDAPRGAAASSPARSSRSSASIGVVERPVVGGDTSDLMRAADITLYSAKADGRGRWALHDPSRDEAEITRFALSAAMPAAIEREEFFALYQPLVSMADHRMRGVEALVRWHHPKLGVLGPARFIGLAEETGAIVPLGHWVLVRACRDARRWYDEFGDDGPVRRRSTSRRASCTSRRLLADVETVLDRDRPARRTCCRSSSPSGP